MRDRLVVGRRELASLRSEKTIVLALIIQLFIAAFSSFLVVGLVSLYSPSASQGDYVVNVGVAGNASDDLAPVVANDRRNPVLYENESEGLAAFTTGDVDALLLANKYPDGHVEVSAYAPEGSFRTTLVVVQLKDVLSEYERHLRDDLSSHLTREPLALPPESAGSTYYGFTYTILLPLLMFLPAFISGSVVADTLSEELERGTFELLRVTPLSVPEIVDGKSLAMIALAPAQAALWLAFLGLNGIRVDHPLGILVLTTALAAVLVGGGAALALRLGERRETQLVYSFGAIGVFALASLLPESPQNVVAKLAVGSTTPLTYPTIVGFAAAAVACFALARYVAGGMD
ncbi:ABC transporter permease [Salarchaeum japonicum]|uniref:ABC transporter permease n=1 Tax=Salarchaeum japonicum TaxID=555573 RepID=UPI003C7665C3